MTIERTLHQIVADLDRDSWTPTNLAELPDTPPIRPDLAQTGLIYPGKRHVFSGPPESAKTLAAYCILIHVARVEEQPAILIDYEMGAYDARQRLRELGANDDDLARILYLEPDERATPDRINTLIEHGPALVVIDAAAGAFSLEGLDDNRRLEVETFTNLYISLFWRAAIATILIDHVVKDTDNRGRFAIGSERKLGGADIHIGFDTIKPIARGTAGRYKLIVHKDRGGYHKRGHLADLHLDSDPDTHHIEWRFTDPEPTDTEGYFRPTHLMEKVSLNLELRSEPATRNAVYSALGGTKDYILKAIDALVREGFITETAGSNNAKLLTSTGRFREDEDTSGSAVRQWFGSSSEPLKPRSLQGSDHPDTLSGSGDDLIKRKFGSSEWFDSGSRTTAVSGGSVVRPPYGDDTTRPPEPDHPEPTGWFDPDGNLFDPNQNGHPNPDDIDWTAR